MIVCDELRRSQDPEQAADRICDRVRHEFGGTRTWVPARVSQERIVDALGEGVKPAEVAKRLGVNVSTVYRAYTRQRRVRSSGIE